MCGLAGIVRPAPGEPVPEESLLRMARAIRHRGPDGFGLARDRGAGFVSARLAIFDIPHGWQPLLSRPGGSLIVYNGEVYNHPELRRELEGAGEAFATTCDTEVVLRLLEREGLAALDRLNGQFAFAWWQPAPRRLTLVRDRFGVRPLYHSLRPDGSLVFGSEAKALFASGEVEAAPDMAGLDEVFTLWGARSPRTPFRGVGQLRPGSVLVWEAGSIVEERSWWEPRYGSGPAEGDLGALLRDSVGLRLRADVPVGAYLSGGLDSSLIAALAQREKGGELRTFSVAFRDPGYDERPHQEEVARALRTDHHVIEAGPAEIAEAFPRVVWHAETPLVRTAPVPLFLLSGEVRDSDLVVVATGEGADELFWGYDLFKEVVVREIHRRDPERAIEMLDGFYAYLGPEAARRGPAWRRFILESADPEDPLGSHLTRARATGSVKAFFSEGAREGIGADAALERLRADLPGAFRGWSPLERAAWLEVTTLLEPYLLATQGDRVAMAHGVEGRFPFLDHRVFAHAAALPAERKLEGTRDKVALRELAAELLPPEIVARAKQPYRAPEVAPFFAPGAPGWVEESLSATALRETGIWEPGRVEGLLRRCRAGRATGVREGMALVGILSTQLWYKEFCVPAANAYPPETGEPKVMLDLTMTEETA
ncbi:MAG: asparagine synthase (glutamine-hydrolyzing) [Solirubrobacterales bacterium]